MQTRFVGCLVVGVLAATAQGQPPAQPNVPGSSTSTVAVPSAGEGGRKWEYSVQTKDEIAKAGKGDFRAGLNKLGDEGWELVTHTVPVARGGGAAGEFYFKRLKAGGAVAQAMGSMGGGFQGGTARSPGGLGMRGPGDAGPPISLDFHVLVVKQAKAIALAETLRLLLGANGPVRIVSDDRTNSLIVSANPEQLKAISELVRELDRVVPSEKRPGEDKAPE